MKCVCGAELELPDMSDAVLSSAEQAMDRSNRIKAFDIRHRDCKEPRLLKIVGYEACTGACAEELATNVQDKMARLADDGELMGWVPYGNPCTAVYSNGSIEYFQMVVRYE